jgi:hypothetical protein
MAPAACCSPHQLQCVPLELMRCCRQVQAGSDVEDGPKQLALAGTAVRCTFCTATAAITTNLLAAGSECGECLHVAHATVPKAKMAPVDQQAAMALTIAEGFPALTRLLAGCPSAGCWQGSWQSAGETAQGGCQGQRLTGALPDLWGLLDKHDHQPRRLIPAS